MGEGARNERNDRKPLLQVRTNLKSEQEKKPLKLGKWTGYIFLRFSRIIGFTWHGSLIKSSFFSLPLSVSWKEECSRRFCISARLILDKKAFDGVRWSVTNTSTCISDFYHFLYIHDIEHLKSVHLVFFVDDFIYL